MLGTGTAGKPTEDPPDRHEAKVGSIENPQFLDPKISAAQNHFQNVPQLGSDPEAYTSEGF